MFKPWDPRVKPSAATAASKPGKRLDLSLAAAAACVVVMLTAPLVGANPTGGVVVRGNAAIATQPGQVTVDQHSGKAVINWNGFSIKKNELTQFNQPGRHAIALNRVITNHPSHINGLLQANGNLWLINQNGVTIGPDGTVQARGFLATTADIADDNFMRGRYQFDRPSPSPSPNPNARVVNQGHISLGARGLGALVAPHARNDGIGEIEVDGGRVLLTAAAAEGIVDQAIQVGGKIHARSAYTDGGEIVLDGGDHGTVAVTGILDASSGNGRGGKIDIRGHRIRLGRKALVDAGGSAGGGDIRIGGDRGGQGPGRNADAVILASEARIIADATGFGDGGSIIVYGKETARIDGQLTARGGPHGGDGGFVETSAAGTIEIAGIRVDASASTPAGKPGTWLIDPQDITIDDIMADAHMTALEGGTNVTVTTAGAGTDAGNITVAASIRPDLTKNPNSTNQQTVTLTLTADNDVNINSGVTIGPAGADAGDSMGVTIDAGNDITNNGTIDVSAGTGGAVSLTAASRIALGRINAGVGDISITATGGAITDNTTPPSVGDDGGAGNENLVGNAINLTAGTGIGGSVVGTDIDIAATSLNATITGNSGGIFIAETDDLALGRIVAGGGVSDITIKAGGTITDQDPVVEGAGNENLVGGAVNLTAGGGIGTPGDAIDTAVVTKLNAQTTGGNIYIDETGNLALGRVDAKTGDITLTAGGAITDETPADDSQKNLVGGAISLTAGNGIGTTGDVDTAASSISAGTTGGGIDTANTLGSPVTVSSLTSGGIGDIRFDQSGDGAVTFNTVTTNDGSVTLTNANAGLSVTKSVEAGGAGKNLTLTTTGSGDITLSGTTTATDDGTADKTDDKVHITSAGAIDGAGLVTAATVDLDATGDIGSITALEAV